MPGVVEGMVWDATKAGAPNPDVALPGSRLCDQMQAGQSPSLVLDIVRTDSHAALRWRAPAVSVVREVAAAGTNDGSFSKQEWSRGRESVQKENVARITRTRQVRRRIL